MKKIIRSILALVILFTAVNGEAQKCWSSFRGDRRLSGISKAELPVQPEVLWTFKASDAIKAPPVVCRGILVVGSLDGSLYGITTDGNLKWKINTGNGIESAAIILDDRVFVGNLDGKVFALELETGRTIWTYETEGQIMGSPNYWNPSGMSKKSNGDGILVIGSYDYYLHGIDAENGQGLWKYETDNFINGTPAIYEGEAVFGGCDGLLHRVRVRDGKLISRQEVATYIAGSAAIDEGKTFVGDYDGKFSCLDIRNRSVVWEFKNSRAEQPIIASPSINRETVFIGSRDKYVYAFNRKNGELDWKTNTRGQVDASPLLTSSGLLVATLRGDVLILDSKNGEIKWSYEIGSAITGNPAVTEDRIYVTAADGRVYCFGKK